MISAHDRSGWFGASDVSHIIAKNTKTKSFANWWLVKLGIITNDFTNASMMAGTWYEHPIIESLGIPNMETDKQILIPDLRLRVNLDGNTPDAIYEIKTYKVENGFKVPAKYTQQVNVQMFAWQREFGFLPKANIVAYGLTPEDYVNYFNPIDPERKQIFTIDYNEKWINEVFLPALEYKKSCLEQGVFPK